MSYQSILVVFISLFCQECVHSLCIFIRAWYCTQPLLISLIHFIWSEKESLSLRRPLLQSVLLMLIRIHYFTGKCFGAVEVTFEMVVPPCHVEIAVLKKLILKPNFEVLVSPSGGAVVAVVDLRKKGPCICWPWVCLTALLFPSVQQHSFSVSRNWQRPCLFPPIQTE